MRLQRNSSQVTRNIVNAQFTSAANIAAEANMRSAQQIGNALESFKAVRLQREEEKDVERVIAANNEYDRRTLALNNEVRERFKEADASQADSYYKEQEALIRREVYDSSGIKYEKSRLVFNNRSEGSTLKELTSLNVYQQVEEERYKGALLQNSVVGAVDKYLEFGDVDSLRQGAANISINVDALAYGKEESQLVKRQYLQEYVNRSVQALLSRKDYVGAKGLLTEAKADGMLGEADSRQLEVLVDGHLQASEYDQKVQSGAAVELPEVQATYEALAASKQAQSEAVATSGFVQDYLAAVDAEGYSLDGLLSLQEQYADSPEMAESLGQIATRLTKPNVRKDSDLSTVSSLRELAIKDDLTEQAVNNAFDKGLLSAADYQNFLLECCDITAGSDNQTDKKFDRFWLSEVDKAYGASYQQKDKEEFVLLAWEKLQNEGATGAKRQELVRKWLGEEAGRQKETAALYKNMPTEMQAAIGKWGWETGVGMLEKSDANLTGVKLAAESDKLAAFVKNYAFMGAQEALDYRLKNNLPVSAELIKSDISRRQQTGLLDGR